MIEIKPKRIVFHGCYSAKNEDLGIRDKNGSLMKGMHDVFVVSKCTKDGFVMVKTVTSLENVKKDGSSSFHESALNDIKKGRIIPIPLKTLNSKKLSGVNTKGIWIHKSKLWKSIHDLNTPKNTNP